MTESEVTDAPTAEAPSDAEDKVRRGRGNLEADIKAICDKYASGAITLAEGEYFTPHRIGAHVVTTLHEESRPSTGAVAACLKRWEDIGFIVVNEKPFAFIDYTDAARTEGLAALKKSAKEAKKAARTAAEPPEEAASDDSPGTGTE